MICGDKKSLNLFLGGNKTLSLFTQIKLTAVFKSMERFPKIAWVGGVSGTPIGRNAEPYLSLSFFFRNFLEIKKRIKKT